LLRVDNCLPNCAYGAFTSTRVHVNVYSPSNGHLRRLKLLQLPGHHYVDVRVVKNRSYTFPDLCRLAGSGSLFVVGSQRRHPSNRRGMRNDAISDVSHPTSLK
jgi:hypothetical protein